MFCKTLDFFAFYGTIFHLHVPRWPYFWIDADSIGRFIDEGKAISSLETWFWAVSVRTSLLDPLLQYGIPNKALLKTIKGTAHDSIKPIGNIPYLNYMAGYW